MTWKTIGYVIESAHIALYPGVSREFWFLDAIQESPEGRKSRSNICSGDKQYCIDTRNKILQETQ